MTSMKACVTGLTLALLPLATPAAGQGAPPAGFTSLFDGKTLNGWRGDPTIWSVRDGAITGGSDKDIPANTFLIFEKPYGDFELRYKYRMNGDGNSGMQFRSSVRDEAKFSVRGLQVNVVPISQADRFGMLWEEGGRGELALPGHKMVIDPKGPDGKEVKHVLSSVNPREKLYSIIKPFPEWNEVVVIVQGTHMVHAINGYLVFDAIDNDPDTPRTGVLAIQTHSGPPMHVQFRDLWVKPLTSFPNIAGRFVTEPGAPTPAEPAPRVPRTNPGKLSDQRSVALPSSSKGLRVQDGQPALAHRQAAVHHNATNIGAEPAPPTSGSPPHAVRSSESTARRRS